MTHESNGYIMAEASVKRLKRDFGSVFLPIGLALSFAGCQTAKEAMKPLKCHKYVIAPPSHFDEKAASYVADRWLKQALPKLRKCDKVLKYEDGVKAFHLLNVTNDRPLDEEEFGKEQATRLKSQTKATHIAILSYRASRGRMTVKPRFLRLKPLREEPISSLASAARMTLPDDNPFKEANDGAILVKSLQLLPNSLQVGFSKSDLTNRRVEEEELVELDRRTNTVLPPIISGISLTSVEHPDGFNTWDVSFRTFVSLDATYIDNDYLFERPFKPADPIAGTPEIEQEQIEYHLSYALFGPALNGEVSVHTPLGASFISMGLGGGIYRQSDSFVTRGGLAGIGRLELGHRAFATERVYVIARASVSYYSPPIFNEAFRLAGSSTAFFGIGYFFPDARSYLRRAF